MASSTWKIAALLGLSALHQAAAFEYYTFDGEGFPSCYNVSQVYNATSVADLQSFVAGAIAKGSLVRAAGKGHMWYDTQCADEWTVIVRTEDVNTISDFQLDPGASEGSVVVDAGVTFFQLAEYLHDKGASVGYTLTNWNISFGGSIAMGAHRSSLGEPSMVAAGALALDIIDGKGNLRHIERNETSDEWLAASTSLGLLGVIARIKLKIYPDTKIKANQVTYDEDDILNGDIYGLIQPYVTANFWWWPYMRKFHHRFYEVAPTNASDQQGFQSTFSVTALEGNTARTLLDSGKYLATSNMLAETIFFAEWQQPNFHEKTNNSAISSWPVYGWNYDVLIGGLYPDELPEWDYDLHGLTLELAVPVTLANQLLKRVRELFDAELAKGIIMTATYRSGINIKFGQPYYDLLGQVTYNTSDGADWSKGAIMFDFPSYRPTVGDHKRFNEDFYINLAHTLIDEFPARPHWTKNTRDIFTRAKKNLDPDHLARFNAVRKEYDPDARYKNVIGEILGFYDE